MSRELDSAVAEAMGWTDVKWEPDDRLLSGGVLTGINPHSTYASSLVPYWQSQDTDALRLVYALRDQGYKIRIYINERETEVYVDDRVVWRCVAAAYHCTFSEAICIAFLRAMGVDYVTHDEE